MVRRRLSVRQESSALTHGLRALLHTVRCIKQHEDALCHLLHASEGAGGADAALKEEVRALLEEMPSGDYMDDLEAVRAALVVPVQSKAVKRQREPGKVQGKAVSARRTVKVQSKAGKGRVKAKKAAGMKGKVEQRASRRSKP